MDGVNGFTCICSKGTTGNRCQTSSFFHPFVQNLQIYMPHFSVVNQCNSSPCLNGATCRDFIGGYTCICPKGIGYVVSGSNCQKSKYELQFLYLDGSAHADMVRPNDESAPTVSLDNRKKSIVLLFC